MHCCLWFRSVFRVRDPWPKRYGYHLSIIYINNNNFNNKFKKCKLGLNGIEPRPSVLSRQRST